MKASSPFHVMTKPAGPLCNLDCSYCFYLEKTKLFPEKHSFKMSDVVLETYIKGSIEIAARQWRLCRRVSREKICTDY